MYLTHQPTLEQVALLERGEITREQAAATLGIGVPTLNSRLCRTGFNKRLVAVRQYAGDHLFKADPDKAKLYDEALRTAAANPRMKVRRLHEQYPALSYQILARKVKAARSAVSHYEI